ncbi:MAG: hypothetical protein U0361_23585 [Nitrospiraceae bacterium]
MTFTLSIAGLAIRVTEPENRPTVAWPLRPFERFLADNATPPDITATVDVTERLPDLPRADVRFDAKQASGPCSPPQTAMCSNAEIP